MLQTTFTPETLTGCQNLDTFHLFRSWPRLSETPLYGHSLNMDNSLFITDSLLCPRGKESPYIFSKFNRPSTDTPLIRTLSMTPSVSVLTGSDCSDFQHLARWGEGVSAHNSRALSLSNSFLRAWLINRSVIPAMCFLTFLGKINFCKSRSYCRNRRKLVDRTVCVYNFLNLLFICTVFVFYWLCMFIKNFLLSLNLFLVYLTRITTTMIDWTWRDTFDVMTTILVTD